MVCGGVRAVKCVAIILTPYAWGVVCAHFTHKKKNFLRLSLGSNQYRAGRVYDLCFMTGAPEGSTESCSGEGRNQTCEPWFTRHSTYLLHQRGSQKCGFSMDSRKGLWFVCVFYDRSSRSLNRKWFYGEAGNRSCDLWFTRHRRLLTIGTKLFKLCKCFDMV